MARRQTEAGFRQHRAVDASGLECSEHVGETGNDDEIDIRL